MLLLLTALALRNDNISGQPASLMFFASSQLYMKEIGCRGVISGDAIVVDAFEELSCANSNSKPSLSRPGPPLRLCHAAHASASQFS